MRQGAVLYGTIILGALTLGSASLALSSTALDDSVAQQVHAELDRIAKAEENVRYRGQYAALLPLGTPAAQLLLKMLQDENQTVARRRQAANALHDLITEELLDPLQQAMGDLLLEPWVETELGLLLARLGQRKYLDRWLQQVQQVGYQIPTTGNLAQILEALSHLGDLQFRSGDLAAAGATHRRRITLTQDLIERVHPNWKQALTDEMWAIHYNLACCLALSQQTKAAFEALEKSLQAPTIRLSMMRVDGDLKSLRQDPKWPGWLAEQQKKWQEPTSEKPPQERP